MKSVPQQSDQGLPERRLKVGWEPISTIARELQYLAVRQQAEVGEGFEPFNPDFDTYLAYERAGSCVVWTARTIDTKVLVGYIVWLMTRGLHCVTTIFASADLVYLAPEYREGMTGYKLIKSGVGAISPYVHRIKIETNDLYEDGRMGVLLKRLGFRKTASVYMKEGQRGT